MSSFRSLSLLVTPLMSLRTRISAACTLLFAADVSVQASQPNVRIGLSAVVYICGRGVGNNSMQCTGCQKWVPKNCSGIKGSMFKVMKSFICRGCLNPATSTGHTSVDIGVSENLELVDKFCYLGGMLSVVGDADAAVEARI